VSHASPAGVKGFMMATDMVRSQSRSTAQHASRSDHLLQASASA